MGESETDARDRVRPFRAVEEIWTADSAPTWAFRNYLPSTLNGVLSAFMETARECEVSIGISHVPIRLREQLNWWPSGKDDSDLLVLHGLDGDWKVIPQGFTRNSGLGQDLWALWIGDGGAALLVGYRPVAKKTISLLPLETWQLRLTWNPDTVRSAVKALAESWFGYDYLLEQRDLIFKKLDQLPESVDSKPHSLLRSALTLADHVDPWTRQQLTDNAWTKLFNKIQDGVAWRLQIERLMPAIGDIVLETLGYDMIQIHIFNVVDKRHEEFLQWQRNETGLGGSLNLLLSEDLVNEIISEGKPRIIGISREDGVMNPHLAQLAGLEEGVVVPLVYDGKVEGVMSLYYAHTTDLQTADLAQIARVGEVLARSIESTNAHENVRLMATVDALTGLNNRRSFQDQLARELRSSQRYDHVFSLIMMDIDNFKVYNDTNGHLMGDHLLQLFAKVVTSSVREQDIVCRYGGEEFAVILPHTDAERGLVVAEKIRSTVAETKFPNREKQPLGFVSISTGVSDSNDGNDLSDSTDTAQELIDRADKALYRAKETGRNRSLLYTPDLENQSKK